MPVRCPKCRRDDGLYLELPTEYALIGTAASHSVEDLAIGGPDDAGEGHDPDDADAVGCRHPDCGWVGRADELEFLPGPVGPPAVITPEGAARYVADRGGSGCPACGHVDGVRGYRHGARAFDPVADAAQGREAAARQALECRECGACWAEVYTLTRIETYPGLEPIGAPPAGILESLLIATEAVRAANDARDAVSGPFTHAVSRLIAVLEAARVAATDDRLASAAYWASQVGAWLGEAASAANFGSEEYRRLAREWRERADSAALHWPRSPLALEVIEVGYTKHGPSVVLRGTEESTKVAVAWLYGTVAIRPVPGGA